MAAAKIRVIHLVQDLRIGGVERLISTIVSELDKNRFDVAVWGLASGGAVADEMATRGICVKTLSFHNCYNPFTILKLGRLLRRQNPDIVHMHGYFAQTLGRFAAILAGVPVKIVHYHSIFHGLSPVNRFIDRFLNLFTDGIVVISKEVQQTFERAGYNLKKAILIYNGVRPSSHKPDDPRQKHQVIISVASLTAHKGHRFLLEAIHQLAPRFPDVQVWLVGDGPLRQELISQTKELNMAERVHFFGQRDDVPDLLCQASIGVLSSLREGLPLSVREAMAAGLPVVVPRLGGLPEAVEDGTTGIIVPPGDSNAMAKALADLLADPACARAMGEAGRKRFESMFTSSGMVQQLEALYERLVTTKR